MICIAPISVDNSFSRSFASKINDGHSSSQISTSVARSEFDPCLFIKRTLSFVEGESGNTGVVGLTVELGRLTELIEERRLVVL